MSFGLRGLAWALPMRSKHLLVNKTSKRMKNKRRTIRAINHALNDAGLPLTVFHIRSQALAIFCRADDETKQVGWPVTCAKLSDLTFSEWTAEAFEAYASDFQPFVS